MPCRGRKFPFRSEGGVFGGLINSFVVKGGEEMGDD
jgi:hypothetical protein